MVLVTIKNSLFSHKSNNGERKALLPTFTSYESLTNKHDYNAETRSIFSSPDSSSSTANSCSSSKSLVNPRVMSDIIIGLSDGLTVPFALTAGLSSLGNSRLVITGGLAELVSGALSMGLGGYLAAKSEAEYYDNQVEKERFIFKNSPETSASEVENILADYNLSSTTIKSVIADMEKSPSDMIEFVIRFGKGLEEPANGRQFTSAMTIGIAYFLGGFVPLIPYFFTQTVEQGLIVSAIVMAITLFIFGVVKTIVSLGNDCPKQKILVNGFQMLLTGGVAAGAAWALVRAIE
jgi:VIT1/CCC1 family predicted Fe2+/Mn2+ transporter